jgi:autotransporter-associated beta strand protein
MSQPWWQRIFQWRPSGSRARRRAKRGRDLAFRPQVRALEGRLVPSVFTWTGGAGAGKPAWSRDMNWTTEVGGKEVHKAPPANGNDTALVFPAGAQQLTNTDNIPNLKINSLTFEGQGYVLNGEQAIDFGKKGNTSTRILTEGGAGKDILNVRTISNQVPIFFLDVGKGTTLEVASTIAGNGFFFKFGDGTLLLSGKADNSYGGETILKVGTLLVGKDKALGTSKLELRGGIIAAVGDKRRLSNDVRIGGPVIIAGENPLTFTGSLTTTAADKGTIALTVTDKARAYFTGVIKGRLNSAEPIDLIKNGPGKLVLAGENSYTGITKLEDGELVVGNDLALGRSELVIKSGTFASLFDNEELAKDGKVFTLNNKIVLEGNVTIGGRHTLVLTGEVVLRADITLTVDDTKPTTFSGKIAQEGGIRRLTKAGAGVLVLAGTNTYTGATTVKKGVLEVNGRQAKASDVKVEDEGTLGGTGTVPGKVDVEGTLRPGPEEGAGSLRIGSLTFSEKAPSYKAVLNPNVLDSGHGEGVVRAGAVDLSKTKLAFVSGAKFTVAVGDRVPLLTAPGGITGEFMNQAKGSEVTINSQVFQVLYEKKAVILKRIK